MSVLTVAVLLIMAACLEVGGDALVRHGLHGSTVLTRAISIFAGGGFEKPLVLRAAL